MCLPNCSISCLLTLSISFSQEDRKALLGSEKSDKIYLYFNKFILTTILRIN